MLSPSPEVVYAPLSDAFAYITPRPPFWLAVAEQLHWPLASVEHSAVFHPAAVKTPDIFEHSTGADETVRHEVANGKVIARASPPPVRAIDTVGAGDAFAAAITIRLAGGQSAAEALAYACAAGALATTQRGAQSAFPMSEEVAIWASRAS